jgi:hypothetical protein
MLKVIKQTQKSTAEATFAASACSNLSSIKPQWVAVRTSQKEPWKPLELPITLGHHPDNDIFVNAPTMRQVSKIVTSLEGRVVVIDAQSHKIEDSSTLRLFGIDIDGPYSAEPTRLSAIERFWERAMSREAGLWATGYPEFAKRVLPPIQQKRLLIIVTSFVFTVAALSFITGQEPDRVDLSRVAIAAEFGNISALNIKSSGSSDPYSKGTTIKFNHTEPTMAPHYVLTITMAGLDMARELSISVNDKLIAETSPMIQCVDTYCTRDFAVEQSILKQGINTLGVMHNHPQSSYAIKSVYLRGVEPASREESELVSQLLSSADRFYEERHLLVQNIRSSKDAIDQIQSVLSTRSGLDSFQARFDISRKKSSEAFNEISSDLQFKLQKELKLSHYNQALDIAGDLLKLYPDPTTKEHEDLRKLRSKLQGVMK